MAWPGPVIETSRESPSPDSATVRSGSPSPPSARFRPFHERTMLVSSASAIPSSSISFGCRESVEVDFAAADAVSRRVGRW